MPSGKHNSIIAMATGLIFSLINVTSSRDVPFRHPQQLQCLHHGSTKGYLCSPLFFIPFYTTALVTICAMCVMGSVGDLGKCRARRGASYTVLWLES